MATGQSSRTRRRFASLAGFLAVSVLIHVLLLLIFGPLYRAPDPVEHGPMVVEVISSVDDGITDSADQVEHRPQPTPTPAEPEKPKGQIVEVPEPLEKEKPDEARFLAENNHKVDQETATPLTAVNPEIVTPEFHPDQKLELQSKSDGDGKEQDIEQPLSIRNPVVYDRGPRPDYGQTIALNTSLGKSAFKPPTRSAPRSQVATVHGAPQNDYLRNIQIDNSTNLNTHEYVFQSFYNRVKRQVNPFWVRFLHQATPVEPVDRKIYTTVVNVILTENGSVEGVEITRKSGIGAFDDSVVKAFKEAGPYLNPPAGMVSVDGRIHLDDMAFTVTINAGRAVQMYIDPRSNIKYPGIEQVR